MSSCEVFDSCINTIDVIEDSVIDDTKFQRVSFYENCCSQGFPIICQHFANFQGSHLFKPR